MPGNPCEPSPCRPAWQPVDRGESTSCWRRTDHQQSLVRRAETVLFKQEAVRREGLLAADRLQAVTDGGSDGEEHSQDQKAGASEDRREGQTLPLRQVPQ